MGAPACVAPFQRTLAQVMVGFSKNLWRLASRCLKMSPNFVVQAAPSDERRPKGGSESVGRKPRCEVALGVTRSIAAKKEL